MKRLLDSNAYTSMRRGDEATHQLVKESDRLIFSSIVVGELLAGFRHGSRRNQNEALLENFLSEAIVEVVPVTRATCEWYATINHQLRNAGTPIPTNDVWIAAHCFEFGAELITFDSDFARVPGLLVRNPS